MNKLINTTMALLACVLVYGCASTGSERNLPSSSEVTTSNPVISVTNVLKRIAGQFPELKCSGPSQSVLPIGTQGGEEWANMVLTLPRDAGDLSVQIERYASPGDAEKAIDTSLMHRPAAFSPRTSYHGGFIHRYQQRNTICQYGRYVIEVSPMGDDAENITMKVLDAALKELPPVN